MLSKFHSIPKHFSIEAIFYQPALFTVMNRAGLGGLGWLILAMLAGVASPDFLQAQTRFKLQYAAAPIDNPLKGLVPYDGESGFPCSLEFSYFPIRDLMPGPTKFEWSSLEKKLADAQSRGRQLVLRLYLEYPGKKTAVPQFLIDRGLELTKYRVDDQNNITPDYSDPRLLTAMESLIVAFGKQYDGDPRIGFITMGVLGHWGEWHTYPQEKLFASKLVQSKIMDAFENSFGKTRILMRYPAGDDQVTYAPNRSRPFGYHDDSFAWATRATGKANDEWFYESVLQAAGPAAIDKWKTQPIGGEIRPEVWGTVFDVPGSAPRGQEFDRCVQETHVSWLLDSGMFGIGKNSSSTRIANATVQIQRMGYELHVSEATIEINPTIAEIDSPTHLQTKQNLKHRLKVKLKIENRGVAPFYYDWPIEVALLDERQQILISQVTDWKLTDTLPGAPFEWETTIMSDAASTLSANFAIRILNPMPSGKPLRFANTTQQADGWLLISQSK